MDPAFAAQYLQQTTMPPDASPAALQATWEEARERLGGPIESAGKPEFLDIGPEHAAHLEAVAASPRIMAGFDGLPFEFKLVQIDPLLAYQFDISVERTDHLCAEVGAPPTAASMLPVLLPTAIENIPFQWQRTPNSIVLVGQSANLRIFSHGQIGFDAGVAVSLFGVALGASGPWVHVVRFDGRTYLRNGFHRVYGMKRAGASHIPCIVVDAPNWEYVGARGEGATFDRAILESANPPTMGHYADDRAWPVQLRRPTRIIEVSWAEYLLLEPDP